MTRIPTRINDAPVAYLRRTAAGLSLAALNISLKVFDPRDYGAVGDGDEDIPTDNSDAFYNCILAAEAYALEHGRAQMRIAAEVYMVQDPTTDSVASLSVPSAPLHLAYGHVDIIGYGATLKIGPNGVSNSVLRSFGDRVGVYGLRIDCNASAQTTAKGNSGFEFNGDYDSFCKDCTGTGGYTFDKYITIDGNPSGGNFTITYNGNTTSSLPYNVTAAAMQAALRLLPGLSTVTVTSVGTLAGQVHYRIPFAADTADFTVADLITPANTTSVTATNHTQGQEHFLGVNVTRCSWIDCSSYDSGYAGFRSSGSDELFSGCWAINHKGNGFRLTAGGVARFDHCLSDSNINSGRAGYLVDAGSAQTYPALRRTRVFFDYCIGRTTVNDPLEVGSSVLKLAAADEIYITGGEMEAQAGRAASCNYAIRLEDNLRKVVFNNVYCKGGFIFTPGFFHGAVSAQASAWLPDGVTAAAQFTLPVGHGITAGNTIFIQDTDIAAYNREHVICSDSSGSKSISSITNSGGFCLLTVGAGHNAVIGHVLTVTGSGVGAYNTTHTVTAITGTTITTNRAYSTDSFSATMAFTNSASPVLITSEVPYTAGAIGANAYAHEGVDEVRARDLHIYNEADQTYTTMVYGIESAHCRILDLEDSTIEFTAYHRTSKMSGIGWNMPDAGLDLMRLKNVKFSGDTNNIFLGVRTATKPTDEQQTITIINHTTPGGSFTLTCGSLGPTAAITWDANPDTVATRIQTALRALTGFSNVTCTFPASGGGDFTVGAIFTVVFRGTVGNQTQLTYSDSMTGGTHSIAIATTVQGTLSAQLVTSGKTIGVNCSIVNRWTGTTHLIDPFAGTDVGTPYGDRLTLFNSIADIVGRYAATAKPTSIAVGWTQGHKVENSATGAGATPGWRCTATTAVGSAPSFQQEAVLA